VEKRRLGQSTLEVSVVGLGCNNFGRRIHDVAVARAVVHRALDLGITLFDTADVYGYGTSESFLGEALGARRKDVVIATKFGLAMSGSSSGGASRRYVAKAAEASLKRLRTECIDLYQVHYPDPSTPIDETMRALDDLVRQGKVRQIGCSNHSAKQVIAAEDAAKRSGLAHFVTCQDEYSLLERGIERDIVPLLRERGMTLLPYSPLASGLLTGKYRRDESPPRGTRLASSGHHASVMNARNWEIVEELRALSSRTGHGMLDLAFGWLIAQPVTASVIAGATSPEQAEQNVRAGAAKLPPDVVAELDRITG
jgi:aryl-alcohol dehydrogenase-like predicted oxidoreductase